MSRSTLRRAVTVRDGCDVALVPLLWRHALRLEQISDDGVPAEPEALARALRNAQALYALDAVTLGADNVHLAAACWSSAVPALSSGDARVAVEQARRLEPLPDPKSVPSAPAFAVLMEVFTRLRPVLGERAGIALVLPDPGRLASLLGVPDARSWASRVLMEVIRSVGGLEPDLFLFAGEERHVDRRLESLCQFFQATAIHLAEERPGKIVLSASDLSAWPRQSPTAAWLYTTEGEIDPAADPERLRASLLQLRG